MKGFDLSNGLTMAIGLSNEISRLLLAKKGAGNVIKYKESKSNIASEVDLEAEQLYRLRLQDMFPSHSIFGEESGISINDPDYCWIFDPLDGTSNYMANLPWFGTMVALIYKGSPIIGVINLPELARTYSCVKGQGVYLNGIRISCDLTTSPQDSLIAIGFDSDTYQTNPMLPTALRAISSYVRGVRMTNSAYDFSMCIDGSVQGVVNFSTKLWDVAAAALILAELGFQVSSLTGKSLNFDITQYQYPYDSPIIATTPQLYDCIIGVCRGDC